MSIIWLIFEFICYFDGIIFRFFFFFSSFKRVRLLLWLKIDICCKKVVRVWFFFSVFLLLLLVLLLLNEYIYICIYVFVCVWVYLCVMGIRLFNARCSCFLDEVYLRSRHCAGCNKCTVLGTNQSQIAFGLISTIFGSFKFTLESAYTGHRLLSSSFL